ncbi:MAG: hypothetical protein H7832_04395 [Magnetococcus sp. DMHC-6]
MNIFLFLCITLLQGCTPLRGVGDMGVVIERTTGSIEIIENSTNSVLSHVEGMGDLSHASVVYSKDARHAFIFGRDGGLSKVDLLTGQLVTRVIQAGNSIGGAISQDGRLVAVSNYEPGGVRIFATDTLALVADIPAIGTNGKQSKVVGLVDAPGQRFIFSLFDADEIWLADLSTPSQPKLQKFTHIGHQPYDALLSPDGRYYIAGLFGEEGLALLDLWHLEEGVKPILAGYGRHEEKLPVYKMPHLEGWAIAGNYAFLPAVGHHEVLVVDMLDWHEVAHIPLHSQPVFVMSQPGGRQIWINFAHPDNDTIQVVDLLSLKIIQTLKPGKGVMHMEFTPRGEQVWISLRDENRVDVYRTDTFERVSTLPARNPSGIFFSNRAHKIGL